MLIRTLLLLSLLRSAFAAEPDFVAAVTATRPLAYYRLNAVSGKSETGASQYRPKGFITVSPGGLFGGNAATFPGRDGFIVTTQIGGIGSAGSMMAWINLESAPSMERRIFYIAGISEGGNDFDLQIESDNVLRLFTASGGNLSFRPPPATLLHRWHMVVATLDVATKARALYWDGQQVAADRDGGRPHKTNAFTIGDSLVFGGRFLKGRVEEAALWNRALRADEVAAMYASVGAVSMTGIGTGPGSGQFPSHAKVVLEDSNGPIPLKPEEQTAFLFVSAIQSIEGECQNAVKRGCTMEEIVSGAAHTSHLKYNPRADPNYTYTVNAGGMAWEVHATPRKSGLMGFYTWSRMFMTATTVYNPNGAASIVDKEFSSTSVEGDSFATR